MTDCNGGMKGVSKFMIQPSLFPLFFGNCGQQSTMGANVMQTYFGGLDNAAQAAEPYYKGMARWQLEMMGLMSRRAQAYLEIPSRMSKCRTPQDVFAEQTRFWQMAFQQYSESSRRMMAAANQMMVVPAAFSQGAAKTPRQRDYISFPDTSATAKGPAPVSPLNGQGKGERRVA